ERRALHATAARALETAYAGRLEEVYDRLGHHYSQAEVADKAIEYLTRLAERAAASHADTEAVRILEEARRHVDRLPEPDGERRRIDLVLRQAFSLIPQGRFQELVDLLLEHATCAAGLGDPAVAAPYHLLLARSYLFLGDDRRATEHAERSSAEAARSGDEGTLGQILYMLAQRSALLGHPGEGVEQAEHAAALLERAGDRSWLPTTYWALAVNQILVGRFEAALVAAERGRALGEAVRDPQAQSSALWATGLVHTLRGDREAGIEACRRSLAMAPDALNTAIAAGWLGYAYLEQGDADEAISQLERSV